MSTEVTVLVNPAAGGGRGARAAKRAIARFTETGVDTQVLTGRDVREAGDLASEAVEAGTDTLVVVGGDGMIHLALQAVAGTQTRLGLIPAGTGNDVARALHVPTDDPAAAADIVAGGHERRIDLGRTDGQWFAGVVAAGFDARVNDRANRTSWPSGPRRYDVATLAELGRFKPISYHLELDGDVVELDAMLVAVGNLPSYGGGLRIAADARIDDGLFDVVVITPVSKLTLLRVFPKVRTGGHLSHPAVSVRRARRVKVGAADITAYVDGERLGPLPRTFEVVERVQRVFVPAGAAARLAPG